jgi:hypothetical protein
VRVRVRVRAWVCSRCYAGRRRSEEPFSPSPASTVRVLTSLYWVTTVRRRDGHTLAGNWTRDSTAETRRRGRFSQQQFVHELLLLIQRARLAFSRATSPVVVGWTLCRFCDTHLSPGASQYMGETGVISKACQPTSLGCQAPKHPATHSSWREETAFLCCTGSLGDGADTVSISSVRSRFMHMEQWGCRK